MTEFHIARISVSVNPHPNHQKANCKSRKDNPMAIYVVNFIKYTHSTKYKTWECDITPTRTYAHPLLNWSKLPRYSVHLSLPHALLVITKQSA